MAPVDSGTTASEPPVARRGRRLARVLALVVGLVAVGVGLWMHLRPPFQKWVEVVPNVYYRSALLPPEELEAAVRRFRIKTVVTLRPDRDALHREEAETLRRLGVPLVEIPLAGSMPPSPAQADELRRLFDDPSRHPLLIHCRHGVVRAAGIEAFYRREYLGEDAARALDTASRFGHDLRREAPAICEFVESLPATRSAVGPGSVPPR